MYGFGGEGLSFFSAAQHMGRCTQTQHCTVYPFLFRINVTVSIAFFRQGGDPIRADIPLFVDRDIFLQFLPILQPPCFVLLCCCLVRCRVAQLVPHFTLYALRTALYMLSLGL